MNKQKIPFLAVMCLFDISKIRLAKLLRFPFSAERRNGAPKCLVESTLTGPFDVSALNKERGEHHDFT